MTQIGSLNSALKINHIVDVAKIANFIGARGLNQRQFVVLLQEHEAEYGDIGYHTAAG